MTEISQKKRLLILRGPGRQYREVTPIGWGSSFRKESS